MEKVNSEYNFSDFYFNYLDTKSTVFAFEGNFHKFSNPHEEKLETISKNINNTYVNKFNNTTTLSTNYLKHDGTTNRDNGVDITNNPISVRKQIYWLYNFIWVRITVNNINQINIYLIENISLLD